MSEAIYESFKSDIAKMTDEELDFLIETLLKKIPSEVIQYGVKAENTPSNILRKIALKHRAENKKPIILEGFIDFNNIEKVNLKSFSDLETKEIHKYFYEFAFSKDLINAVNKSFKDLEFLNTVYLFDSFKPTITDAFYYFLLYSKHIKSDKINKENGITEFVHIGTNFKLEEKLYNVPNDYKLICSRSIDFDDNGTLASVYSILFFIDNVTKNIQSYVIVNDNIMNKKALRKLNNDGSSTAIKFIKNEEFILKNIIDEIVSEKNNDAPF